MKLKPKSIAAEYINSDKDYTVIKIMGSPALVYGDGESKKKTHKAIAFKDTNMMREVAKNMLVVAEMLEAIAEAEKAAIAALEKGEKHG